MHILSIETSCDETSIALVDVNNDGETPVFSVRSHITSSQAALHNVWGGVVPNMAKREHEKNLIPLLLQVLGKSGVENKKSGSKKSDLSVLDSIFERETYLLERCKKEITPLPVPAINLIAVTQGPGLEPALWTGVNMARALSYIWNIPLLGVNHMEGHIISAVLKQITDEENETYALCTVPYPALALLVSGGHTELILIKKGMQYEIIGATRDDAAGEAFDKVARLLELGYPGGPAISHLAKTRQKTDEKEKNFEIVLPRPMLHSGDFDFSFSGIKTAVLYLTEKLKKEHVSLEQMRPFIAKEFQDAVTEVLVTKTMRAAKKHGARAILLGGGVAANDQLRRQLGAEINNQLPPDTACFLPSTRLTGDNALMIAIASYIHRADATTSIWKTLRPEARMRL